MIHVVQTEVDHLPVAHACSFAVDLPLYKSEEQLRRKFTQAMEHTEFGIA